MEGMKSAASGVVGDLARARIALDERGQKLGELEERTAAMMASADSFSKHAHDVHTCLFFPHCCIQLLYFSGFLSFLPQMMIKYKDKKWYQLWWHLRRIGLWNHSNHQCLLKTAGPPFLFSVSPHRLSKKQLLHKPVLFFSAPYHKLCFTSAATDGGQQHRHRLTQSDENGKKWKNIRPYESFFPLHFVIIQQDRGDLLYP